jgi:hypothetical protein
MPATRYQGFERYALCYARFSTCWAWRTKMTKEIKPKITWHNWDANDVAPSNSWAAYEEEGTPRDKHYYIRCPRDPHRMTTRTTKMLHLASFVRWDRIETQWHAKCPIRYCSDEQHTEITWLQPTSWIWNQYMYQTHKTNWMLILLHQVSWTQSPCRNNLRDTSTIFGPYKKQLAHSSYHNCSASGNLKYTWKTSWMEDWRYCSRTPATTNKT